MPKNTIGAPEPPPAPITRQELLPIAALLYATAFEGTGVGDVAPRETARQLAVMHAIELAKEVERQLREEF
jgi:hypothetical protein